MNTLRLRNYLVGLLQLLDSGEELEVREAADSTSKHDVVSYTIKRRDRPKETFDVIRILKK